MATASPVASGTSLLWLTNHLAQGQREPEPEATPSIDQFERVLATRRDRWDAIWEAATDHERRTLLDEYVGQVNVADHLDGEVSGAPKLNVALHEVGLQRTVENGGVGGPLGPISTAGRLEVW